MSALAIVLGYLLGSLPFAVLVSRALKLADPRSYGSGNPGATNVLRTGNRAAAALTLAGDAGKGAVAVWLGGALGEGSQVLPILCGAAAFCGHVFPIFLRFRGGKGVATFLGVVLAFEPRLGLLCCVVWLGVALASRYSSLAALSAAAAAPVALAVVEGPDVRAGVLLAIGALLVWRHRSNIGRLIAGTEGRIGRPSPPPVVSRGAGEEGAPQQVPSPAPAGEGQDEGA